MAPTASLSLEDRRARRSRKLLMEALRTLMQTRRYDKITVQDIIEAADVGRSTFYAHWQDKDELLVYSFDSFLETLPLTPSPAAQERGVRLSVAPLLAHMQEQSHYHESLAHGNGLNPVFQHIHLYLERQVNTLVPPPASVPQELLSRYVSGAFFSLLEWWQPTKMSYSPEALEVLFNRLVMPTLAILPLSTSEV